MLRNQRIAYVSQQVELFGGTVADNIRFARPQASDDEVVAAAKAASAHDFIMSRPDGYSSRIGENGLKLSGGQRQRLAIARALLMKPSVLVLDEATSALDAATQAEVQATLDGLMRARACTIVIVAHRLSTVRGADKLVVLSNGRIEAQGSHQDLILTSPSYKRMVELES